MRNKDDHFASCFAAKQTTKNEKEVLRLAVLQVVAQNKHTLNAQPSSVVILLQNNGRTFKGCKTKRDHCKRKDEEEETWKN